MTRIPTLIPSETNPVVEGLEPDAVPDAMRAKELDDLVRGIPRLISLLPDVLTLARSGSKGGSRANRTDAAQLKLKHQVALHEMTARLVKVVDRVRPNAMVRKFFIQYSSFLYTTWRLGTRSTSAFG